MTAVIITEAICLRGYDFSESSRALHFYSPQRGLIRAAAKGMRGAKSALSGVGEKLAISHLQLRTGASLHTILQYQSVEAFPFLRSDLMALACASLLAETTHRLGGEDDVDAEPTYMALRGALYRLQAVAVGAPQTREGEAIGVLAQSLLHLLSLSGYAPALDYCVVSGEPLDWQASFYAFSPELGGVLSPDAARRETGGSRVNVSTATLRALSAPERADWQRVDATRALGFLRYYLTYRLERPLRAFTFLLSLTSAPTPASTGASLTRPSPALE
ncbi:MAG: DNA repair protein RecO [Vampirovibrionales bacterium]|nr:DNA repair protein RecO [Vampirovibrionales bacterium]